MLSTLAFLINPDKTHFSTCGKTRNQPHLKPIFQMPAARILTFSSFGWESLAGRAIGYQIFSKNQSKKHGGVLDCLGNLAPHLEKNEAILKMMIDSKIFFW